MDDGELCLEEIKRWVVKAETFQQLLATPLLVSLGGKVTPVFLEEIFELGVGYSDTGKTRKVLRVTFRKAPRLREHRQLLLRCQGQS
jgi:hypothetical protein